MLNRAGPLLASLLLVGIASAAGADAFSACWAIQQTDPVSGRTRSVTVCRLADGETEEYAGDTPPGPVDPAVGSAANGECWYWTSSETNWEILFTFADGTAILGYYQGDFLVLDTDRIPHCTSEPDTGEDPEDIAWDAITQYVHAPPEPEMSPPTGLGLAGMETFLGVPVPGPWSDTITIPGSTIDVEVRVGAVTVAWGDDHIDTFDPEAFDQLVGYPDGIARHTYEVKTCDSPGSTHACHPDLPAYPVTASYVWEARWRANGASWITVAVPPSDTTVDYPVAESTATLTEAR